MSKNEPSISEQAGQPIPKDGEEIKGSGGVIPTTLASWMLLFSIGVVIPFVAAFLGGISSEKPNVLFDLKRDWVAGFFALATQWSSFISLLVLVPVISYQSRSSESNSQLMVNTINDAFKNSLKEVESDIIKQIRSQVGSVTTIDSVDKAWDVVTKWIKIDDERSEIYFVSKTSAIPGFFHEKGSVRMSSLRDLAKENLSLECIHLIGMSLGDIKVKIIEQYVSRLFGHCLNVKQEEEKEPSAKVTNIEKRVQNMISINFPRIAVPSVPQLPQEESEKKLVTAILRAYEFELDSWQTEKIKPVTYDSLELSAFMFSFIIRVVLDDKGAPRRYQTLIFDHKETEDFPFSLYRNNDFIYMENDNLGEILFNSVSRLIKAKVTPS
jgi:hypothetical protein